MPWEIGNDCKCAWIHGPFSDQFLWVSLKAVKSGTPQERRSLNTWSFLLCCYGSLKYGVRVGGGGLSPVWGWQWGTLTNWRNPVQKSEQPPATSVKKIFLLFHLHPLSTLWEPPQQGPCGELVSVVIILTPASTEDGCCSLWGGKWSSARRKTQTQHRDFEKEIKESSLPVHWEINVPLFVEAQQICYPD